MVKDVIQIEILLKKYYPRKYINSTGGLLKKRISKRAVRYALTFKEDEFKKRKSLSKLWVIPDLPIKALIKRIKRVGIHGEEKFRNFSMQEIIETLEQGNDYLACFYFLDKYSKKLLLSNAFLVSDDDSFKQYLFNFVDEEKERLTKEYQQIKKAKEPFEVIPDLIEDIHEIFGKKLIPMISIKSL